MHFNRRSHFPGQSAIGFTLGERVDAAELHARNGLPCFFEKLKPGNIVNIAYFGGSVTQAEGWRVLTHKWFRETYPLVNFQMIQASFAGTGSDFGAFRVTENVISKEPDLVFIEFGCNDPWEGDGSMVIRAMEGIVRQIWGVLPVCDICFIYSVMSNHTELLRTGKVPLVASLHEYVADHYGIPSINLGIEVARLEGEGSLVFTACDSEVEDFEKSGKLVFASDIVHPRPKGHEVYLGVLTRSLACLEKAARVQQHRLVAPFDPGCWENTAMINLSDCRKGIKGLKQLERSEWPDIDWSPEWQKELWRNESKDAEVRIRFEGTGIGMYDVIGPDTGSLLFSVDGCKPQVIQRFDKYCASRRHHYFIVTDSLFFGEHEAVFTINPDATDKMRLVTNVRDDPELYANERWYPSALLILGKPA